MMRAATLSDEPRRFAEDTRDASAKDHKPVLVAPAFSTEERKRERARLAGPVTSRNWDNRLSPHGERGAGKGVRTRFCPLLPPPRLLFGREMEILKFRHFIPLSRGHSDRTHRQVILSRERHSRLIRSLITIFDSRVENSAEIRSRLDISERPPSPCQARAFPFHVSQRMLDVDL